MFLTFKHISTLVVRIDALCRNIFAQFIPSLIKITNVDGTSVTHFLPRVTGIADVRPIRIRQLHPGSTWVWTWSRPHHWHKFCTLDICNYKPKKCWYHQNYPGQDSYALCSWPFLFVFLCPGSSPRSRWTNVYNDRSPERLCLFSNHDFCGTQSCRETIRDRRSVGLVLLSCSSYAFNKDGRL